MKEKIKRSVDTQNKSEKKERIPWLFGLEVKDLVNPITIRRRRILQASVLMLIVAAAGYFTWDHYLRQPSGLELVDHMVEAAGGMEAWNNIQHGQFNRAHKLYSQSGELLESKNETFYFNKTDGQIDLQVHATTKDGEDIWIGKDQEGHWASKDKEAVDPILTARGMGMMCDSKWCEPLCASSMAFYRFSMPFKLTDFGVIPELEGIVSLDGKDAQVLDVTYKPGVGKDRWVFYSYPEDNLIRKIEYHNKADQGDSRPEEIYWSDHRTEYGITFSHKWTRYWSNGQLLEEYTFSDVNFESELPENFFERPEGHDWVSLK